jgi:hypothetical protein
MKFSTSAVSYVRRYLSECQCSGGQAILEYALVIAILSIGMILALNAFGEGIVTDATAAVASLVP